MPKESEGHFPLAAHGLSAGMVPGCCFVRVPNPGPSGRAARATEAAGVKILGSTLHEGAHGRSAFWKICITMIWSTYHVQ